MIRKTIYIFTIFTLISSRISAQECVEFYNDSVLSKCRTTVENRKQKEVWKLVSDNIVIKEFQLKDGMKNGIAKTYSENGKTGEVGRYVNNRRVGKWRNYYENGTLRSLEKWAKSHKEGSAFFYHSNGIIWSKGRFKSGIQTGKWKFYDTNSGKLTKIGEYDEETNEITVWRFYDSHKKLIRTGRFDKTTFEWRYFDKDGKRINWSED